MFLQKGGRTFPISSLESRPILNFNKDDQNLSNIDNIITGNE